MHTTAGGGWTKNWKWFRLHTAANNQFKLIGLNRDPADQLRTSRAQLLFRKRSKILTQIGWIWSTEVKHISAEGYIVYQDCPIYFLNTVYKIVNEAYCCLRLLSPLIQLLKNECLGFSNTNIFLLNVLSDLALVSVWMFTLPPNSSCYDIRPRQLDFYLTTQWKSKIEIGSPHSD